LICRKKIIKKRKKKYAAYDIKPTNIAYVLINIDLETFRDVMKNTFHRNICNDWNKYNIISIPTEKMFSDIYF
jgi:hypothetical protein